MVMPLHGAPLAPALQPVPGGRGGGLVRMRTSAQTPKVPSELTDCRTTPLWSDPAQPGRGLGAAHASPLVPQLSALHSTRRGALSWCIVWLGSELL